mmetsp:Transcript_20260/g.33668  ORF Transcript_20260/g.33668 Transcript_20260/m.33668 type:complete len:202 (+) Transcript_20260:393-998(+)
MVRIFKLTKTTSREEKIVKITFSHENLVEPHRHHNPGGGHRSQAQVDIIPRERVERVAGEPVAPRGGDVVELGGLGRDGGRVGGVRPAPAQVGDHVAEGHLVEEAVPGPLVELPHGVLEVLQVPGMVGELGGAVAPWAQGGHRHGPGGLGRGPPHQPRRQAQRSLGPAPPPTHQVHCLVGRQVRPHRRLIKPSIDSKLDSQ